MKQFCGLRFYLLPPLLCLVHAYGWKERYSLPTHLLLFNKLVELTLRRVCGLALLQRVLHFNCEISIFGFLSDDKDIGSTVDSNPAAASASTETTCAQNFSLPALRHLIKPEFEFHGLISHQGNLPLPPLFDFLKWSKMRTRKQTLLLDSLYIILGHQKSKRPYSNHL